MTTMEIMCLMALTGFLNVACFLVGARTGQKIVSNEKIELPTINPVKVVQNYQEDRKAKKEEENFNINLENIDTYDGTSIGQKDFI